MVSVKIQGRLANQLFQYAFIYSTAKRLNTSFYIDKSVEKFILPTYFNLKKGPFYLFDLYLFSIQDRKHIFSHHLKKTFYKTVKNIFGLQTITISNSNSPVEELKKVKNHTIYDGFFQSELYFKEIKNEIKKKFSIKDKYKNLFVEASKCIPNNKTNIVIHIRKGDYVNLGLDLPLSYYHTAIKSLEVANPFFIFISDQTQNIMDEFEYIQDKYISKNDEIIDFQFLLNADICILSNSTFSWWGAYLNEKKKQTIAPKYWLNLENTEYPHSIILKDWAKI